MNKIKDLFVVIRKIEDLLIERFPVIIFAFTVFWLGLVAYGLLNQ